MTRQIKGSASASTLPSHGSQLPVEGNPMNKTSNITVASKTAIRIAAKRMALEESLDIYAAVESITDARSFIEAIFMACASLSKDECDAIQIVATRALDSINNARACLNVEVQS